MSDFALTLGGVEFRDFEIPDNIAGGGAQRLKVHKYAGDKRTVDAFGPDPAPLRWDGVFLDEDAESRCQQLDAMRVSGVQVPVSWSSFNYIVTIAEFVWKYEKFYRIPYSITLEVVEDRAQSSALDGEDPESAIQGDLDDTANFSSAIGDTGLSTLTDGLTSLASSVPSITGAPSSFLTSLSGQISDTLDYVGGLMASSDEGLTGIPALTSGGNPADLVHALLNAASNSNSMALTFSLHNTLGRLQKNVAAITG